MGIRDYISKKLSEAVAFTGFMFIVSGVAAVAGTAIIAPVVLYTNWQRDNLKREVLPHVVRHDGSPGVSLDDAMDFAKRGAVPSSRVREEMANDSFICLITV